ncbi:pyocin knob domain-containing protein [uncultured Chryseobacterium sp.]|uniref:pyocin knob domain-containing protein n=1 Tax=uncultured Chryseobacterium sp. TaxID=259322 RepID=UPI0025F3EC3A|nr:pyocin knob domain-containing protein [uncultured Chryseobacterium sp.]
MSTNENMPISGQFWDWMQSYWHTNRSFPPAHPDWRKKADLVNGKVPAGQLPSCVDDVLEFNAYTDLPKPGEKGKIYITTTDNKQFRWGGSAYIEISSDENVGSKIINGSYNANNLTKNSITYGYSVTNAPSTVGAHSFTVLNLDTTNPDYKMQLGFDGDTNEMFSRIKSGGNWTDWSKYVTSSLLGNFVTTNTNQLITGLKAFVTGGGNYGPLNNALQIYADDGSLPAITFSNKGSYVGQVMFDAQGFYFKNGDNNSFYNVKSKGFIKNGSDDNYLLTGGGGHKPILDFIDKTTPQGISGVKVFSTFTGGDVGNNALWVLSSDGSNPAISFIKSNVNNGQIGYNGSNFTFLNTNSTGYVPIVANSFIKEGSDNNYILLGGGGHKPISEFVTPYQLDNYWKKYELAGFGYIGINTSTPFAFLNGNAAQKIFTGGLLTSDLYADNQYVPNNGIYSKGNIDTSGKFTGNGFVKRGFDDNYLLLAGGSTQLKSDFVKNTFDFYDANLTVDTSWSHANINTPSWFPVDQSGTVLHKQYDSNFATQLALSYYNGIAYRHKMYGTWSNWKKIYSSDDFNPDLKNSIDLGDAINNGSSTRTNKSWFDYDWAGTGQRGSIINFSGLNGNYSTELFGSYDVPNNIGIRTRNGDTNKWNSAKWLWHSGNFNPGSKVDATDGAVSLGFGGGGSPTALPFIKHSNGTITDIARADRVIAAWENAQAIGFNSGLSSAGVYVYHKKDGYIQIADKNWVSNNYFNKKPIDYTGYTGASYDLNTLSQTGFYNIGFGTLNDAGTYSNNGGARALLHFQAENPWTAMQIQTHRYKGNLISRSKADEVWSTWVRHWGDNDFTAADVSKWNNTLSKSSASEEVILEDDTLTIQPDEFSLEGSGAYDIGSRKKLVHVLFREGEELNIREPLRRQTIVVFNFSKDRINLNIDGLRPYPLSPGMQVTLYISDEREVLLYNETGFKKLQ